MDRTMNEQEFTLPQLHDLVARHLGIETQAARECLITALQNIQLINRKQQDYGPKNISAFGSFGVLVRMNDKFERLKHIFGKKRRRPMNESIRDSFRDLANYATIALVLEEGRWPKE